MVSGAEALQPGSMGMFAKVAGLEQGDRPVYMRKDTELGTVQYLFYWLVSGSGSGSGQYLVGPDYKVNQGFLYSPSKVQCPEFAAGWQVWDGKVWAGTYLIAIRPGAPGPPRSCVYRIRV